MTGGNGGVHTSRTYASVTGLPSERSPAENQKTHLVQTLTDLMSRRREGVTLREARRACPLLFDPDVLKNYSSVRHLLSSMPEVVRLEGCGVQTRLYLPKQ